MGFANRRELLRSSFLALNLEIDVFDSFEPLPSRAEDPSSGRGQGSLFTNRAGSGRPNHSHWTIWWQRPDKWREDYRFQGGELYRFVVSGAKGATYVAPAGILTKYEVLPGYEGSIEARIEKVSLLDDAFLSEGWTVNTKGAITRLGRHAIELHTTLTVDGVEPSKNTLAIDEWELVMDAVTGVLLVARGFREGRKVAETLVRSISTPSSIPDSIFSLDAEHLAAL